MLGTRSRLSILPDREIRCENEGTGMVLRSKLSIHQEMPTPESPKNTDKSLEKVLKNINLLLENNSKAHDSLVEERDQLKKMEQLLREKLSLDDKQKSDESCKENEPPSENTSPMLCVNNKSDKLDDQSTVPQNQIINEMRSAIKFLKTPRPSRMSRKSIILTPHSMSFCIQKQFEDLLE